MCCAALAAPAQDHSVNHSQRVQQQKTQAVSAGVYGMLGLTSITGPVARDAGLQGQFGGYAEYARYAWQPGADARLFGSATGFGCFDGCGSGGGGSAKLIGPRLSYVRGLAHPYVEGLFGIGDQDEFSFTPSVQGRLHGTEKLFVAGFDIVAERHLEVRLLEYSIGRLNSSTAQTGGATLQSFSTGLVFRFP